MVHCPPILFTGIPGSAKAFQPRIDGGNLPPYRAFELLNQFAPARPRSGSPAQHTILSFILILHWPQVSPFPPPAALSRCCPLSRKPVEACGIPRPNAVISSCGGIIDPIHQIPVMIWTVKPEEIWPEETCPSGATQQMNKARDRQGAYSTPHNFRSSGSIQKGDVSLPRQYEIAYSISTSRRSVEML